QAHAARRCQRSGTAPVRVDTPAVPVHSWSLRGPPDGEGVPAARGGRAPPGSRAEEDPHPLHPAGLRVRGRAARGAVHGRSRPARPSAPRGAPAPAPASSSVPAPSRGVGGGGGMKTIGDLVAGRETFHVGTHHTVREAARYMTERRVGAVSVLEGTRLVGILSERDIMGRVVARQLDPDRTDRKSVV